MVIVKIIKRIARRNFRRPFLKSKAKKSRLIDKSSTMNLLSILWRRRRRKSINTKKSSRKKSMPYKLMKRKRESVDNNRHLRTITLSTQLRNEYSRNSFTKPQKSKSKNNTTVLIRRIVSKSFEKKDSLRKSWIPKKPAIQQSLH